MNIEELKIFLRLRESKVTGKKRNLGSKSILCYIKQYSLVKTVQDVEAQLKEKYSKKLELENHTLSDPFKIKTRWMEKEDDIAYWQIIPDIRILNFLMINSDITDLSDYKALKGEFF